MTAADGERSLAYLSTIPVSRVKGLTGKRATALNAAGIESVTDLLFHVPRRYIDRSTTAAISDVPLGEEVTVVGTVQNDRHAPGPQEPRHHQRRRLRR